MQLVNELSLLEALTRNIGALSAYSTVNAQQRDLNIEGFLFNISSTIFIHALKVLTMKLELWPHYCRSCFERVSSNSKLLSTK